MFLDIGNEVLWLIFMFVDLSIAVIVFKLFKREGLFMMIIANIIIANIQVIKLVEFFGITATLGNIVYGSIFFSTDLLNELYGKKEARKGVILGFVTLMIATLYMQFAISFTPSAIEESLEAHKALSTIFGILPRIAAGSLIAYIISQLHDVWAFDFWKRLTKGKYLWLRNNLSTMVSQFLDSLIFVFIAFWGTLELNVWWQVVFTTYVFKWFVAAFDTPFIYLARWLHQKNETK
jgi:hypothetical protein